MLKRSDSWKDVLATTMRRMSFRGGGASNNNSNNNNNNSNSNNNSNNNSSSSNGSSGGGGGRGSVTPESETHSLSTALGLRSSSNVGHHHPPPRQDDILLSGYLKKLKTGKRKFFILRKGVESTTPTTTPTGPVNAATGTADGSAGGAATESITSIQPQQQPQPQQQARLEYFDSEKKWTSGAEPKRSIVLRNCFNINRKHDAKGRLVVALYTAGDCLALQCANAQEQETWLSAMLRLQQGGLHLPPDFKPSPNFDHIWEVNIKPKSLGTQQKLQGDHRLCLTARVLTLVRLERQRTSNSGHSTGDHHGGGPGGPGSGGDLREQPHHHHHHQSPLQLQRRDGGGSSNQLEFPLNSIRRCGHTDCFFFMELGRSSVTGAGELWMQTDDTVIAQNMHEVILSAMKSSKLNEELPRPRSSSTSENSSRPVAIPHTATSVATAGHHGSLSHPSSSPHSSHHHHQYQQQQQHTNSSHNGHPHSLHQPHHFAHHAQQTSLGGITGLPRERCDSLPARSRQSSGESLLEHQAAGVLPARCNTMDCSHAGHGRPWSAGAGGASISPLGHLHAHSSLESCAEEPSGHTLPSDLPLSAQQQQQQQQQQLHGAAPRSHLHLNVTGHHHHHHHHPASHSATTNSSAAGGPPHSIMEEGDAGMSDYLTMSSPGHPDSGTAGSLLGSPATLTDGPSSLSSGHGIQSLPGPHSVGGFPTPATAHFLPHQTSSASSSEYMKMSPTQEGVGICGAAGSGSAAIQGSFTNANNNANSNNSCMYNTNKINSMATGGTSAMAANDSSYMSMSPVGSSPAASINLNGTLPNGYVPMEPLGNAASMMLIGGGGPSGKRGSSVRGVSESSPISPSGYMEMAPLSSSLPKSVGGLSGSWGSSLHSLHDPSPTFHLSVAGFQLDKVKSFIATGDADDNDQSLRTGRSFSCGKRPSDQRSLSRSGPGPGPGTERVRAYSVGSQANHPAAIAAAAKKRQQQQQQGQPDVLGTPTSDRGRSNSYSKKSSSTTTLGSRHSEEFMEINYDENWHRATASAAAAAAATAPGPGPASSIASPTSGAGSLAITSSPGSVTSMTACASKTTASGSTSSSNNDSDNSSISNSHLASAGGSSHALCSGNNNVVASTTTTTSSATNEYLPMMRGNYKDSESMKLFPLKELEVTPSPRESSSAPYGSCNSSLAGQQTRLPGIPDGQESNRFGGAATSAATGASTLIGDKTATSEYMDLSGPLSPPSGSAGSSQISSLSYASHGQGSRSSAAADAEDGEYVSLDMSRPWQTRSLSQCGAPEPKKSKPERLCSSVSVDANMAPESPPCVLSQPPSGGGGGVGTTITTRQHGYENLSFGANGATVDAVSSAQAGNHEPMDTDQPQKLPPPAPAPSPTPEHLLHMGGGGGSSSSSSSSSAALRAGLPTVLMEPPASPPTTPVPSPSIPMQVVPGSGPLSTISAVCHELNYASLDLPPVSEDPAGSPSGALEGGTSGAGIVPPGLGLPSGIRLAGNGPSGVSYSQVDFRKSEGLRGSILREGGRV